MVMIHNICIRLQAEHHRCARSRACEACWGGSADLHAVRCSCPHAYRYMGIYLAASKGLTNAYKTVIKISHSARKPAYLNSVQQVWV